MVKPDVIITIPYGIESPYFRYITSTKRNLFNKIICGYYNDHRKYNFVEFLKEQMPYAIHVDIGEVKGRDWRNDTVNACLEKSDSEWVLFIEDDFVMSEGTLEQILTEAEDYDIAGYGDMGIWSKDVRLHPAFILVKRKIIDKTNKDFGAYPEKNRDHFATFTEEIYDMANVKFHDISMAKWEHLKGTYSNYMLVQAGQKPNYEPQRFRDYVEMTLSLPGIKWDERFLEWSQDCLKNEDIC